MRHPDPWYLGNLTTYVPKTNKILHHDLQLLFVSEKRRHLECLWIIRARWGWRANYLAIKNFSYFSPRHRSLLCGFRDGGGIYHQVSYSLNKVAIFPARMFTVWLVSKYLNIYTSLSNCLEVLKKRISSLPAYHCYICKKPFLPKKKYHGLIWRDNWQGGWVTRFGL